MNQREQQGDIMAQFARMLGTTVLNNEVHVPEGKGSGCITGFKPNEFIGMVLMKYRLSTPIELMDENKEPEEDRRRGSGPHLTFLFQNCLNGVDDSKRKTVQISTMGVGTEKELMAVDQRADLLITIYSKFLARQFPTYKQSTLLRQIIEGKKSLFFENTVNLQQQNIIRELTTRDPGDILRSFYQTLKISELVCELLITLLDRDCQQAYPVNHDDLKQIYNVRDYMLAHLNEPPVVSTLAAKAAMSVSKLERLFKQIFGDSLFHYYQLRRMERAAELLKSGHCTVASVGYQLGFSNLSHFSRLFEKVMGKKPKKYTEDKFQSIVHIEQNPT